MIRAIAFSCQLPKAVADALNRESGRIYTEVLVRHYRIYRKKGIWLRPQLGEKISDFYNADKPRLLHAHSIDAAQQGFYKACKTAKANRDGGAKYPRQRKQYRSTTWKNTGIRVENGVMFLALARGLTSLSVSLPKNLCGLPSENFREAQLVYNKSKRRYVWHITLDDGQAPAQAPGNNVAAVDLGEVHPVTITDGDEASVITCRELRALNQYTNKRLAALRAKQAKHQKYSRRWWKLQRRKNRFLAGQEQRKSDLEHKISHAVVEWAQERKIGKLAIGNVRDIADGKRLNTKSQQKIGNWSHGKMRRYIQYKAEAAGIQVTDDVDEHYTSQTCPQCGHRHKPKGRVFTCSACGAVYHRDVVGAANILSRFVYGELAKVPATHPKYRYPFDIRGKRSPSDTGQVARKDVNRPGENRQSWGRRLSEAARLQT